MPFVSHNDTIETPHAFPSHFTPGGTFSPLFASSFVRKLYFLVSAVEHKHIIGWVRDGVAFEVRCPKLFESEILPRFFRHSRFQSFVRQLNFYAFKKISRERSSWVYIHEFFQRDKPELLDMLRRKTYNSGGDRSQNSGLLRVSPPAGSLKRRDMGSNEPQSPPQRMRTDKEDEQHAFDASRDGDRESGAAPRRFHDSESVGEGGTSESDESEMDDGAFTHDESHSWKNAVRFFDVGRQTSAAGNTSGSECDTSTKPTNKSGYSSSMQGLESPTTATETSAESTDEERSRSNSGPDATWSLLSDCELTQATEAVLACCDRGMGACTAKMAIFCMEHDPFTSRDDLPHFAQFFLRSTPDVARDLDLYTEALAPPQAPLRRWTGEQMRLPEQEQKQEQKQAQAAQPEEQPEPSRDEPMEEEDQQDALSPVSQDPEEDMHVETPSAQEEEKNSQRDSVTSLAMSDKNEVTMMHTFMMYAVSKLQEAAMTTRGIQSVDATSTACCGEMRGNVSISSDMTAATADLSLAQRAEIATRAIDQCVDRWWSFSCKYT